MVSVTWVMSHDTIKRWLRPGAGLASGLLMCPLWCVTMSYMPIVMPCDNTRDDNHFPMAITSAYTTSSVKVCLIAPDIFEGIELIILCLGLWMAVRVCYTVTTLQCEKIWAVIRLERADWNAFLNLCSPCIVMLQYWAFVRDEKEPLCKYDFQLIPLYHFLNEIP